MSATEVVTLGLQPIREGSPAGDSARDEPEFEALQEELRKLEHPAQPAVDWDKVVRNATFILESKSKDLLVASYLCVGLLHRDGLSGLDTGLSLMRSLVQTFWETLHPGLKRVRGRVAALEWLAERGMQGVQRTKGTPELLEKCRATLEALSGELAEKLEEGGTLLSELKRALAEAAERQKVPEAKPAAATAAPTSGIAGIQSADDVEKALAEIRRLSIGLAAYLRQSDPANPLGYRLLRSVIWSRLNQLPPHSSGQTQIPAPPEDLRDRLRTGSESEQWPAVLAAAEERLPQSVLWLDLNRFSARALEGMGEEFEAAATAIREELGLLVRRFPELLDLRFADDSPIADSQTQAWIKSSLSVAPAMTSESPALEAASDGKEAGREGFEEARETARKLAGRRKLPEALRILEEGAARAGRLRDRVVWQMEMVRTCLQKGKFGTARAQLEILEGELSASRFEEWQPELAEEVYKGLYLCIQKGLASGRQANPEDLARLQDLKSRLCRLSVLSALELDGKK